MIKEGRATWLKLGGLGILLFLAVYGLVVLESSQKGERLPVRRTTYSAAAGGYKALYLWLQALNIPVQRWEKPLGNLSAKASVLLMVEPDLGPGTGELRALKKWVGDGGTLILIASRPNLFLKSVGMQLKLAFARQHKQDIAEMFLYQPGIYTRGIWSLDSSGHPGLDSGRPETVVHIRSSWGGLLAAQEEGKGRVIALADPNLMANESLRDGDHSRLALNILLSHRGDGGVLIDEYHHGYGRATSVLEHLTHSRALQPMLQGGLLLLILWAAKGRRFGPPRPLIQEERRSSLEYVRAMAQLFQRARARPLALKAAIRWIEDEAEKTLVYRDRSLQSKLLAARRRLEQQEIGERELLKSVRGLYLALDEARNRAVGTSRQRAGY
jgi:hypothetical protein